MPAMPNLKNISEHNLFIDEVKQRFESGQNTEQIASELPVSIFEVETILNKVNHKTVEEFLWNKLIDTVDVQEINLILDSLLMLKELTNGV